MKFIYLLIAYIIVQPILVSCGSDKEVQFTEIEQLEGDTIPIEQHYRLYFMHNTENFLLLSGPNKNTEMLHIYSLPDLKYLSSSTQKGRASNEINNFAMFCKSDSSVEDFVYVYGFTPTSLREVSILNMGELQLESKIELGTKESFNNMFLLENKYLIYFDPMSLSIVKYDIVLRKNVEKIEYDNSDIGSSDKNFGIMSTNGKFIVYAYRNRKKIDIYNCENFELLVSLKADENPKSELQYYNVIAGKNNFYAICAGQNYTNGKMTTSQIEVYDYEGNPVKLYELKAPITRCIIDEHNGYIYGYVVSDQDYFVRYKIK